MMLRAAIAMTFLTSIACVQAGTPPGAGLTSCVGTDYLPLQLESPRPIATDAICLAGHRVRVCRRLLTELQSGEQTSEVVVERLGQVVQKWSESGDPSYLQHIHAFRSSRDGSRLIVATQQSESMGMGVQEWLVNVLDPDQPGRRTFQTAEFGPQGALVADRTTPHVCHLLRTQWETRPTQQGDRLFLMGQLISLDDGTPLAQPFYKRFDRKLKRQRETPSANRPLRYFQP